MTKIFKVKENGTPIHVKTHYDALLRTDELLVPWDMPVIAQTKEAMIEEPDARTIKTNAVLPFGDIENEGIKGVVSANKDIPFSIEDGKINILRDCTLYITIHFQTQHINGNFYYYCDCFVLRDGKNVQIERFTGMAGSNINWKNDANGSIVHKFIKGDVISAVLDTNTTDFVNVGLGRCRIFQVYPVEKQEG